LYFDIAAEILGNLLIRRQQSTTGGGEKHFYLCGSEKNKKAIIKYPILLKMGCFSSKQSQEKEIE